MNRHGLILTQPETGYRYSLDPFLLADFSRPRARERIVDLGAGVGVVGLLLARRHPTVEIVGIELDPDLAHAAATNARANGLSRNFRVIRGDVRVAPRFLPPEHFHRVVANPPFRRAGSGARPPDAGRAAARQELTFTLADLARTAAALLRFGGSLDVIHLAERLPEICVTFHASGLEPKRARLVAPFPGSAPRLCLITAVKGARPGLRLLPQLELDQRPGTDSPEPFAPLAPRDAAAAAGDEKHQPDE